ncbi:MAG: crossover junction endodeoxyribonuclease RuvC [Deltaproteobacteria bacterium]|nr:crossover junction endodeoxyribonuclease RuvC [Deltaproteobacteria bacterium]
MRVLGIDPGTRSCGWGVVERVGSRLAHVAHGTIRLGEGELAGRLVALEGEVVEVLAAWSPESAAIEAMFFGKNAESAAKLAHARGVVMLALRRAGLELGEYPPARVKSAVAATGQADKNQIARVVAMMLGLKETPQSDAADALALAITHTSALAFAGALKRGPSSR